MAGSPTLLIARREIVTRLQQRGYRIGLLIGLAVVILGCTLPAVFRGGDKPTHYDIGVATQTPGLASTLTAAGRAENVTISVHDTSSTVARDMVKDGKWDVAVLPGNRLIAKQADGTAVRVTQAAYQLATTVDRLTASGLTKTQVQHALQVQPLVVSKTEASQNAQRQAIALVAVVFLFAQLITFCTWVAMGVVEEKASRVVELILSSVRPVQLLAGKLIGIGVIAAAQVLVLGVVAVVAASASNTLTLPASGVATLAISFVGFVLGYAFFAALAAGLGSTVSRQEEVSGILAPVTVTLMVCYGAAFAAANSADSTLAKVVSIVPPFSAIALPARIAHGGVPVTQIVLAVALLLVAAIAMLAAAARVYRASILHSGTRVSLKRAWRGDTGIDRARPVANCAG